MARSLLVLLPISLVLRQAGCEQFLLDWTVSAVKNVSHTLDTMLADTITVQCPADRFDNIVYLPTWEQLERCNASVLETTPTHLVVGTCTGGDGSSFDIDIKRTSGTLASAIPFQSGGTYYFTTFTDGTIFSVADSPSEGGDCLKDLYLIVHVLEPATSDTPPTSSSTSSSSTGPTSERVPSVSTPEGIGAATSLSVSMTTCTIFSLLASLLTQR